MNVDSIKVELIDWIARLNDNTTIEKIMTIKRELSNNKLKNKPIFGSGKNLIKFISDDFNEPLDHFNDYRK